jgi:hypothetical protein
VKPLFGFFNYIHFNFRKKLSNNENARSFGLGRLRAFHATDGSVACRRSVVI